MSYNAVMIRRRNAVITDTLGRFAAEAVPAFGLVASLDANLRKLGYALHGELAVDLMKRPSQDIEKIAADVIEAVKEIKGVRNYRPMYPNFPQQVMDASEGELYLNAIMHYFGIALGYDIRPEYDKLARPELDFDESKYTILRLGNLTGFHKMMTEVATQKSAFSETDRADLLELSDTSFLLNGFETFDNRENKAWMAAQLYTRFGHFGDITFDTATDVLRLAVALSDGDVSLAEGTKFKSFKRSERKMLMSLLERVVDSKGLLHTTEDMARHAGMWKRLGERLHPGEFHSSAADAFAAVRNGDARSFNSYVESHLGDPRMLKSMLMERPGDFVRRLDAILSRTNYDGGNEVLDALAAVAHEASTTVLLQALTAFQTRHRKIRTFIPKGQVAHLKAVKNERPRLEGFLEGRAITVLSNALERKLSGLEKMGKVYIDPELENIAVPFGMRSASKQLATLGRGSRVKIDDDTNVLRFFIWWKNNESRVDIDLSAIALDANYRSMFDLTYYNLRENGAVHSGDITNAPNGASEFIDITIDKLLAQGVRYVAMNVHSYSGQDLADLPECFAGFMSREKPQSGEVYDPRTVTSRVDLAASSRANVPYIFDLEARQAIWVDLSVGVRALGANVANSKNSMVSLMEAVVEMQPPNLYELFRQHARARGTMTNRDEADIIFALDRSDDPRVVSAYDTETILSQYL